MKKTILASCAALLLALPSLSNAQVTLTAWTFDNLSVGANSSPTPSTGLGTAAALGMSNSYNNTNSVSNPDVQSLAGSSTGGAGPLSWRIRGAGSAPNAGNGWSTNAPIGTQGAQFSLSTYGYYGIKLSFDAYATPDAEANLMVQYTTGAGIWNTATITSAGNMGILATNTLTNSTVRGTYVILTNNGTTGWNNGITVDLTGVSGVDNNANFAVRLVNASTGSNCVDTTGAFYNNTSGSWTFDNVSVQAVPIDAIADWLFDSYGKNSYVPNPVPELSSGNATFAQALGFTTGFTFSDGSVGATNDPDVTSQAGSSTPSQPFCWRVRGQGPGNGWFRQSGIGTQGAEFDVSTVNYTNIVLTFDLYFTTQGEAKMMVEYTLDGTTWINAPSLAYAANPNFIVTNNPSMLDYSLDTVNGTYFYQTTGQNWYNNLCVDFTGVPGAANNSHFGIRIVDAAQNNDCVAFNGGPYNNSSGNCRFDNVSVGGHFNGLIPPVINYTNGATVDNPFTNSFIDNPGWRASITAIFVNGVALTNSAYGTNNAGFLVFNPAKSVLLQTAGNLNFVIFAAGYSNAKFTQPIAAGATKKLSVVVQPSGPSASGGTLTVNPAIAVTDQYGNGTTAQYPNLSATASVGSGAWTLGGATTQTNVGGFVWFTNLSATVTGSSAVNGAVIALTINGYTNSANHTTTTNINLSSFNISGPVVPFTQGNLAVFQIDTVSNNTTFSIIEMNPSTINQTNPANVVPISATATNALRQSSAGSTGRLALSDDRTLLCFDAFLDGSAITPDETFILTRAAVAVNYTNQVTTPASYVSISLGGSEARAAVTVDDTSWVIDDKGGLFYGNGFIGTPNNLNALNNVSVKSFGGSPYGQTQKTQNGNVISTVYQLVYDSFSSPPYDLAENNLGTDPVATDFYLVSTNCGATYDVLYTIDQVSSSVGIIKKFSWVPNNAYIGGFGWETNGSYTNVSGGDGLCAITNRNGSVYLFLTTGGGGTAGNSIVRFTDASSWNQPINIVSSNLIYTASTLTSIKGITFVPVATANAALLTPGPVLIPQAYVATNGFVSFSITNITEDTAWRGGITAITVNGTALPLAAYNLGTPGVITFDPTQSASLRTPGIAAIAVSAPGFSTNYVSQLIVGAASQLAVLTQPKGPTADGGPLVTQPQLAVEDAVGSTVITATPSIVASVATNGAWAIGGTTTLSASAGILTFTNITALSTAAFTNANISFTSTGLTSVKSKTFSIPAPIRSLLKGSQVTGGAFTFNFTNITGLSYSVRSTNNIQAPILTWPIIGSPTENPAGSGHYQFSDPSHATNSDTFYILTQP
jgi:hypothetical protein